MRGSQGETRAAGLYEGRGWNAAMPAMYPTFIVACFMERVWRFALPLVVAQLHKSLLPVAVVSFVGQVLSVFLPFSLTECCVAGFLA